MRRMISPQIRGFVIGIFAFAILAPEANAAVVVGDLGNQSPGTTDSFSRTVPTSEAAQFAAALPAGGEVIVFDVSSATNIAAAAVNINLLNVFGIDNFAFKLVQAGDLGTDFSSFTELAGGAPVDGVLTLSYSGLTSGTYGFLFTGVITGSSGGFYAGNLMVSAIPLPPAAWLFISALIGLVGVARRKHKRSAAVAIHPAETPRRV